MKKFLLIFLAVIVLMPVLVLAADLTSAGEKLEKANVGLSSDLNLTVGNVMGAVFYITGTVFLGLIIYGSVVWIKSAGREAEIERAKKIIIAAVFGTLIVMASYGITNFVLSNIAK